MIGLRTSAPSIDNFVIVVHGLHDSKDFGWGLAMPMTDSTVLRASYEVLQPLLELRNKGASGAQLDDFETKYSYTNPNLNLSNATYPQGSVSRIVGKMRQLQQLKVRIVELRACTLGTNKPGLEIVGQGFGARFIVAPDVHMFYVGVDVARGALNRGAVFDAMLKRIPRARRFENPLQTSERLAIGVTRGGGVSFVVDVITNTVHLKWFTEGMDLLGGQYALPQEQAFVNHLVEVGPLAGNLI
jgi:hypothetical protein